MDQTAQTMIDNLHKNTGRSLEEWVQIVRAKNFGKHGEIIKFLKEEHSFTHGFANLVAHKARESDAGSATDTNDLVTQQYTGKEHFKPLYNELIRFTQKLGSDVEVAPKNAYVSLRRKKQFAIFQPATKTRFEVQLNLKGEPEHGVLQEIAKANAMCSHKIDLANAAELTDEVYSWIRQAYERAG
ncbi:MAG: DUF4287 domain-containing protein [Flavobacteriales bacterium]|nr:DUF4287 domain-containing protein [Flavobacteriales bacterium]